MSTLIAANMIIWLSIFTWFMPAATDKQYSNEDVLVIEHKLSITE